MNIQSILDACLLSLATCSPVLGGDINKAFMLTHNGNKYFLKVNDATSFPGMFQTESTGLKALSHAQFKTPEVLAVGKAEGKQYLLLEWIESGKPNTDFWKALGSSLAHLHRVEQPSFGWKEHNYIGSLVQHNYFCDSWNVFFIQHRIMPLVRILRDAHKYTTADVVATEIFCNRISDIFPLEKPCLLHGDLWNGNFMVGKNNMPVLIDPAVYCGHREIDIGMTKLFGGFDDSFYQAYHDTFPLEKGWKERLPISQLYPLLVHAVLFGGGYISQTLNILKRA